MAKGLLYSYRSIVVNGSKGRFGTLDAGRAAPRAGGEPGVAAGARGGQGGAQAAGRARPAPPGDPAGLVVGVGRPDYPGRRLVGAPALPGQRRPGPAPLLRHTRQAAARSRHYFLTIRFFVAQLLLAD